jgi:hypothetical protein
LNMQLVEGVIDSSIAGTPKMTLVAIASKADSCGHACLTLEQIACFIGRNARTVIRAVIELEAAGLLRVVKEHGQPTHYFIEMGGAK